MRPGYLSPQLLPNSWKDCVPWVWGTDILAHGARRLFVCFFNSSDHFLGDRWVAPRYETRENDWINFKQNQGTLCKRCKTPSLWVSAFFRPLKLQIKFMRKNNKLESDKGTIFSLKLLAQLHYNTENAAQKANKLITAARCWHEITFFKSWLLQSVNVVDNLKFQIPTLLQWTLKIEKSS